MAAIRRFLRDAGAASIITTLLDPALPLDEGDRVVAIQNWDRAANNPEGRILHDVLTWRDELTSVQNVGAFRQVGRNLIAPGGQPETVRVAEMTASGFRVARVSPLFGRYLMDDDERAAAPPVLVIGYDVWRNRFASDPGIVGRTVQLGDTTYSVVGVMMDRPASPTAGSDMYEPDFTSRYGGRHADLMRRLKAEPGVSDVTFALVVPGEEPTVWIEVDGVAMPAESESEASGYAVRSGTFGHEVRFNRVDVDFFDAFDVPVLMGRAFNAADVRTTARAVIVNRSFAQRIVGDSNVLGRRVRYVGRSGDARPEHVELGRWYEIVGVVSDFPANATEVGAVDAKLYHAAAPGQVYPVDLAVRVRGAARTIFAGRLREIAAAVDPNLQLRNVFTMDEVLRKEQGMMRLVAAALAVLTLSVVLLSAAGIYSMMSFTVTQRRREIGIRAALGADPRRILGGIFSRALGQLAIGAVLGMIAAALLEQATGGDLLQGHGAVVLPVVAVFMTVVGLLAALGPARRGLRIDPSEALKTEG